MTLDLYGHLFDVRLDEVSNGLELAAAPLHERRDESRHVVMAQQLKASGHDRSPSRSRHTV